MSILIALSKNNNVSGKDSENKSEKRSNFTWRGGTELGVQSGGPGTELGFDVEGGKYNFLERDKYNFSWTYFLKS